KTARMVFTLYDDGQFSVAHETEQERFYTAGHAGEVGHDTWWEASTRRTFRSGDEWIAAVAAEPSPGSRVLAPTTSVANDVIASIAPEIARATRQLADSLADGSFDHLEPRRSHEALVS